MSSRLSSLLVRDGVIGVKRMEKAFQRQVLFGGELDTILLEMSEVSEQRLLQYLSLATGLPPATARELERMDSNAAAVCSMDMAERFRVVPLSFEGDALRVLARDPVDLGALEDLASELGVPVQPFVAAEFRFELTLDRAFARKSDDRFVRIERMVKDAQPPTPVGKPQTVVVDGAFGSSQQVRPFASRQTLPIGSKMPVVGPRPGSVAVGKGKPQGTLRGPVPPAVAAAAAAAPPGGAPRPATVDATPVRARTPSLPDAETAGDFDDGETPPEITMELSADMGGGVVERIGPNDTQRIPFTPQDSRASDLVSGQFESAEEAARGAPVAVAVGVSGAVAVASGATRRMSTAFDTTPLSIPEARALLEQAEHRDLVFEILLRAIRSRCFYAAVLTVQGGSAIGRLAIVGDEVDQTAIAQVLIPLDTPSNFRQAVTSASPYFGPVATGDGEIDAMVKRMGGVIPPSAMLLPLVLKNRVVALLVGHHGADSLRVTDMAELLPLASFAGEALGRIIMRGKTGPVSAVMPAQPSAPIPPAPAQDPGRVTAPMSPAATAALEVEHDLAVTQRIPTGRMRQQQRIEPEPEPPEEAAPGRVQLAGAAELLAQVQSEDDEISQAAIAGALRRGRDVLAWLHEHFPGRLKVDRFELGGRHLRAAQHGPVLELVVRLGPAAGELLLDKMRDGRREVRYYAVLCVSEIRFDEAAVPLVERLFDSDYGIREVALEGLGGYPARALSEALEIPRRELHSEDLERIKTAATALSVLADVRAIPELLDVHGRGGEAAAVVSKALVGLTKQDFGLNNKKWRQWWDKHRRTSRIEWLLEGLASKDADIRRSSVEDLRKATGEYFGFHHDLPKKEREAARQRWLEWWNQTGQLRFRPEPEHERHRPTAVLPPRRT